MKETSYEQPLWNSSTSDEDTMYKTWQVRGSHDDEEQEDNGWDQVKLSHSRSLGDVRAENFPTASKSDGIETDQDRFHYSERTGSLNSSASNGEMKTETEAAERPRFEITIEKPIRHVTPARHATFPQWSKARTGRRASDGLLTSARYSGRNAPPFSALSEERSTEDGETSASSIAANNSSSRVSRLNYRRFSDGCFHSVPKYTGSKKVSVVLPQPRKSVNVESTACGTNEIAYDSDVKEMESADCSRNEEDDRWKELVARAQGFRGPKANGVAATKGRGIHVEDVKGNISRSLEMEDVFSDISSEASFSSNSSYHSSSDSDSAVYSALPAKPISGDLAHFKEVSHTSSNASKTVRQVSTENTLDSCSRKNHPRRYSVATFSPTRSFNPATTAKISGYSTQSALEQARQLLGKLQLEGKNKNKKERLEELSRALKWILEELNRIETPDRDLVSLFISLRAKIVNLKSELKTEEFDATCIDPCEVDSAPRMQRLMLTEDNFAAHTRSRRFSWC